MTELNYKEYSLEQLENWIHDTLSDEETTPSEIYNTIIDVIVEQRDYHKKNLIKTNELLQMMRGSRPQRLEYQGSTVSSVQYTDEELNAMCDAAELKSDQC